MEQPKSDFYLTEIAGNTATAREVRHTPGPWFQSSYEGGWDCVREAGGQIVCKLVLNEPANARLIAAAPDMLSALLYVRDMIESGQELGMSRIHAAIAQALGAQA